MGEDYDEEEGDDQEEKRTGACTCTAHTDHGQRPGKNQLPSHALGAARGSHIRWLEAHLLSPTGGGGGYWFTVRPPPTANACLVWAKD